MNEQQLILFLKNQAYGTDYVFGQPIIYLPMPQEQLNSPPPEIKPDDNPDFKEIQKNKPIPFILHKVDANQDTLLGLSIQYNISANKIRHFNDMDNDEIYYMKTIKIPYKTEEDIQNMGMKFFFQIKYCELENIIQKSPEYNEKLQKLEKAQKLSYLRDYIVEKEDQCDQIANYYLQEANWDEIKAKELYQEDLKWEKQHQAMHQPSNEWIKI